MNVEKNGSFSDFLYKWLIVFLIPIMLGMFYWIYVLFSDDENKITVIEDRKEFVVSQPPNEVKVIQKMLKNYTPDTPVQNKDVAENMSLATEDAAELLDEVEASQEDGSERVKQK